ncbi:hypothetical protein ACFS5N_04585 [Mucilaginibacter ximonensis]|uniref:Baseplate J-like protein n=1 Tax=Mucilaginibacter ximonensis TaxID=538021 RepID=A0ABW5Y8V4_9SPHI
MVGKITPVINGTTADYTVNSTNTASDSLINETEKNLQNKQFPDRLIYSDDIWPLICKADTPVEGWIYDEGPPKKHVTHLVRPKGITAGEIGLVEQSVEAHLQSLKDVAKNNKSFDEIKIMNKENEEFHRKMSMLADHPDLLRAMGWIYDFSIKDTDGLIPGNNIIKLTMPSPEDVLKSFPHAKEGDEAYQKWAGFINEIDFKCPYTAYDKNFAYAYSQLLSKSYYETRDGFINGNPSNKFYSFSASQIDDKQIKGKLAQLISNNSDNDLNNKAAVAFQQQYNGKNIETNSTGIGLSVVVATAGTSPLLSAAANSPETFNVNGVNNETANIDDYIIWGHHLDAGYRIDVANKDGHFNSSKFASLCFRTADYYIDQSPDAEKTKTELIVRNYGDEPWIAESAQVGKSGKLYVDAELFRWNNWSLTCPHIGNYPQEEEAAINHEFNDLQLQNIRPYKNMLPSLIPLRFGLAYFFRLRMVDICGNGPQLEDAPTPVGKEQPGDFVVASDYYKRFEHVNPPELHYTENIYQQKLSSKKGKDRTFYERVLKKEHFGENLNTLVIKTRVHGHSLLTGPDCERVICPPRVTYQFAELHGTFDRPDEEGIIAKLDNHRNIFQKAAYNNIDQDMELFHAFEELPFITDPCVENAEITTTLGTRSFDLWGHLKLSLYLKRRFFSLLLSGSEKTTNDIMLDHNDTGNPVKNGVVKIELKPGSIYKASIKSTVSPEPLGYPGLSIFNIAGDITTPKDLLFVHAVQKPVVKSLSGAVRFIEKPDISCFSVIDRSPLATNCVFRLNSTDFLFPVSTAANFKLIAQYEEISVDRTRPDGKKTTHKKIITSFSNMPDDKTSIHLKLETDNDPAVFLNAFNGLANQFPDTKFHNVSYSLEATSRYKDYFPDETEFTVTGHFNGPRVVKNSKTPSVPDINIAMPVFDWQLTDPLVTRSHSTIRIYFNDDWFETGDSEQIAVLYLPDSNTVSDEMENLISEFGKDPITASDGKPTAGITKGFFRATKWAKVDSRLLQKSESEFSAPLAPVISFTSLTAAIFDVAFDLQKQQFYCDVLIDMQDISFYFPFLKLAICKYQANSIAVDQKFDYRFSKVKMVPTIQLMPTIRINTSTYSFETVSYLPLKRVERYLILEKRKTGNFDMYIHNKTLTPVLAIKLTGQDAATLKKSIADFGAESIYLEEFEIYETEPSFTMQQNDGKYQLYNPRNDMSRRLTFTYQII